MLKEFRDFLIKGNAVDMAIGFIFGAAFATLVKSLVTNVIMPPIGKLLGNVDFSQLFIAIDGKEYGSLAELEKAKGIAIKYGLFINDLISFIILGFVIFMFIKAYNKMKVEEPEAEPTTKICSECAMEIPIAAKICGHCGNREV